MNKKTIIMPLLLLAGTLASCGGQSGTSSTTPASGESSASSEEKSEIVVNITDEDVAPFASEPVTIKFWNPITGPDAEYLQNLVSTWNKRFSSKIEIYSDSLAEDDHYKRILTSFSDNSTADLCLVHRSRLASYYRADKLRDMTALVNKVGITSADYVSDTWNSGLFGEEGYENLYGLCYDLLPTLLYYNKKLIPEGYTEEMIKSADFTLETMIAMMKKAYVHATLPAKRKYGIAFNYAYTEAPFLTYLYQQGGMPLEETNPTQPTYANEMGYAAANAIRSLPFAKNDDGYKVSSESGADHLNVFAQGRALFTIDGIWSTSSAVLHNDKVDTGMAYLPKLNSSCCQAASSDGHSFVTFTNKYVSDHKDDAIGLFIKYMTDNTAYWCKGGNVAAKQSVANDPEYMKLEWAFPSTSLSTCVPPVKTYTYDAITNPIGTYVSKLCEDESLDTITQINQAAKDGKEAAEKL